MLYLLPIPIVLIVCIALPPAVIGDLVGSIDHTWDIDIDWGEKQVYHHKVIHCSITNQSYKEVCTCYKFIDGVTKSCD